MNRLKSIIGYAWAILAVLIAPVTFLGHGALSRTLADVTGVTVHPRYSGGEVVSRIDHGPYSTSIHRPVFDALVGESKEGFIQMTWAPASALPERLEEPIDYNRDGRVDFAVSLNTATGEAALVKSHPTVRKPVKSYRLSDGWAVRVRLIRRP